MKKNSYLDTPGWDEEFRGWGGEDSAFRDYVVAKGFKVHSNSAIAYHLYHDREHETMNSYRQGCGENRAYYRKVYKFKSLDHMEKHRTKIIDIGNVNKYESDRGDANSHIK